MIFVITDSEILPILLLDDIFIQKYLSMRRILKTWFAAVLTAAPFFASAHAGHSEFPADHILHYLATPVHAVPLLMAAALTAAAAWIACKEIAVKSIRNPTRKIDSGKPGA